jgi:hypothetical protein
MSRFERFPLDYEVISASSELASALGTELGSADNHEDLMIEGEDQFNSVVYEFAVKNDSPAHIGQPGIPTAEVQLEVENPPDISPVNDARFAEMVDILEEFDREVKMSMQALTRRCEQLAETNEQLASFTVQIRDQNLADARNLYAKIENSASVEQQMLADLFLAIDSKIGDLSNKIESKNAENEQSIDELKKQCLLVIEKSASLESRMLKQEQKYLIDHDEIRKLLADGLSRPN